MADESQSGTTLRTWSDPPIIDSFGNAWRITPQSQVSTDGIVDHMTAKVSTLSYYPPRILLMTTDNLWWSKVRSTDAWYPPAGTLAAPFSPNAPDPRLDAIIATQASQQGQLVTQSTALATLLMANGELQSDLDARTDALAEQLAQLINDQRLDALLTLAGQILVIVRTLRQPAPPAKRTISAGPVFFTSQPAPSKPGP